MLGWNLYSACVASTSSPFIPANAPVATWPLRCARHVASVGGVPFDLDAMQRPPLVYSGGSHAAQCIASFWSPDSPQPPAWRAGCPAASRVAAEGANPRVNWFTDGNARSPKGRAFLLCPPPRPTGNPPIERQGGRATLCPHAMQRAALGILGRAVRSTVHRVRFHPSCRDRRRVNPPAELRRKDARFSWGVIYGASPVFELNLGQKSLAMRPLSILDAVQRTALGVLAAVIVSTLHRVRSNFRPAPIPVALRRNAAIVHPCAVQRPPLVYLRRDSFTLHRVRFILLSSAPGLLGVRWPCR